jgi:centrosomal CEP192-like protein
MMSFAVNSKRLWMLAMFLGLVAVMLLAADRAAADEEGGIEDSPPALGFTEITPGNLGYEGGNVQIQAEVTDDVGVGTVYAEIYGPNGNQAIQLFEGFEHNYFGTLEVPANYFESPVEYQVEIQAYDSNNAYIASLIGGVQVEAAPQFDEAPYISSTEMFPQVLPSEGGQVTIRAEAGDNRSLSGLFAMVYLPGGGSTEVGMNAISSNQFEGTFTAPPNPGPLGAEYIVEVVAQDDIGQEARASAGIITVEAPVLVPGAGHLETWLPNRSFGSVRVGGVGQRSVSIRNVKEKKSTPIEATVRLAGAPAFSLPGAPAAGVHFTLEPGARQVIPVEFRPTVAGSQTATLEVVRADGGQPGFAVALSGQGVQTPARR